MHPPTRILKLYFDGSFFFFQKSRHGGGGGVIRDSTREILHRISGPIECLDSNGAEVYAMLMSCRELLELESYRAIIEGESFSVIQWGLRQNHMS